MDRRAATLGLESLDLRLNRGDLLGEARLRGTVAIVPADALHRSGVARSHGPDRGDEPRAFLEERRSEVPVVEDLQLGRLVLEVNELIANDQHAGAGHGDIPGL